MRKSLLEDAINGTTIGRAWNTLGLPGKPGKSCKSPFRDDHNPSFSIFNNGKHWKDHATGESGNVVDFVAIAENISNSDACKWLINVANRNGYRKTSLLKRRQTSRLRRSECAERPLLSLNPLVFNRGSDREVLRLKESRLLPVDTGIRLLIQRGILVFGGMYDVNEPCGVWLLTDSSCRNAQARRLDAITWAGLPGHPKAKTIKGSQAAWPIGAADLVNRDVVLLCEGGPDLVAAATMVSLESTDACDRIGFVCIAGASNKIALDALPLFAGKIIRIYQHADDAGRHASARWYHQLRGAGAAYIDRWESDREGEDLNDYVSRISSDLTAQAFPERITPPLPIQGDPRMKQSDNSTNFNQTQLCQ